MIYEPICDAECCQTGLLTVNYPVADHAATKACAINNASLVGLVAIIFLGAACALLLCEVLRSLDVLRRVTGDFRVDDLDRHAVWS